MAGDSSANGLGGRRQASPGSPGALGLLIHLLPPVALARAVLLLNLVAGGQTRGGMASGGMLDIRATVAPHPAVRGSTGELRPRPPLPWHARCSRCPTYPRPEASCRSNSRLRGLAAAPARRCGQRGRNDFLPRPGSTCSSAQQRHPCWATRPSRQRRQQDLSAHRGWAPSAWWWCPAPARNAPGAGRSAHGISPSSMGRRASMKASPHWKRCEQHCLPPATLSKGTWKVGAVCASYASPLKRWFTLAPSLAWRGIWQGEAAQLAMARAGAAAAATAAAAAKAQRPALVVRPLALWRRQSTQQPEPHWALATSHPVG